MTKVPAQPPVIRLRLEDALGVPFKDASCTFEWREVPGHHLATATDADGVLTVAILPNAKTAKLTLFDMDWTVIVAVAPFGDTSTPEGLAGRLENLGMLALPPQVPLSAADSTQVSAGIQRYKELKKLPPATSLQDVGIALTRDHDTL